MTLQIKKWGNRSIIMKENKKEDIYEESYKYEYTN